MGTARFAVAALAFRSDISGEPRDRSDGLFDVYLRRLMRGQHPFSVLLHPEMHRHDLIVEWAAAFTPCMRIIECATAESPYIRTVVDLCSTPA